MWKWIIAIVVIVVLVLGGGTAAFLFGGGLDAVQARFNQGPKPLEVRIEPVVSGDLVRTISAPGTIEARTVVKISAQVSSRITALPFQEGEEVKAGDVVVRLDDVELRARLDAAHSRLKAEQARLAGSRASMQLVSIELGRQRELFSTRDIPKSALDAAEATYQQAAASLAAAEASIEAARAEIAEREKDLANAVIEAPIDGVITKLDMKVGEQVLGTFNNVGSLIMEISDLREMLLKARVDETNIGPVRPGQRATISINAYPKRTFTGTLERIKLDRQIDRDGTGYFECQIVLDLEPGERLYTGLTANTEIEVERYTDVAKIPSQAVLDRRTEELPADIRTGNALVDQDKAFTRVVYRVIEGKTVATPVTIGASDLTHTIITAGLTTGDRVVTGPYKFLVTMKHDQAVTDMNAPKVAPGSTDDTSPSEIAATAGGGGG